VASLVTSLALTALYIQAQTHRSETKTTDTVFGDGMTLTFSSSEATYRPGEEARFYIDVLNTGKDTVQRIDFSVKISAPHLMNLQLMTLEDYSLRGGRGYEPGKLERVVIERNLPLLTPPGLYALELVAKPAGRDSTAQARVNIYVEASHFFLFEIALLPAFFGALLILVVYAPDLRSLSQQPNAPLRKLIQLLYLTSSKMQLVKLKDQLIAIGTRMEGYRSVLFVGILIRLVIGAYASHPAVWENVSPADLVVLDGFNPFCWVRSFGASFYLFYLPVYVPVLLFSVLGLNQQFITLLAFKVPPIIGDVIIFYSLLSLGRVIKPDKATFLASLYFLNPYAVFLSAYTGHFDQLMISLVLAGICLIVRRKPAWAALCLSISVFFRYVPILAFPAFVVMSHHFMGKGKTVRFVSFFLGIATALAILQIWTMYSIYSSSEQGFWAFVLEWLAVGSSVGHIQVETLSYNFTGILAFLKLDWSFLGWRSFLAVYAIASVLFVLKRDSSMLRRTVSYIIAIFTWFMLLFPMAQHHYLVWIFPFVLMSAVLFGNIRRDLVNVLWLSNLFIDPIVWGNFRYVFPLLNLIPWLNRWPSNLAMRQAFGLIHASSLLLIGIVSLSALAPRRIDLLKLKKILEGLEGPFSILIAMSLVALLLGALAVGRTIDLYSVSIFYLLFGSMLIITARSKLYWNTVTTTAIIVMVGFFMFSPSSSRWLLIFLVPSVAGWLYFIHKEGPGEMPSVFERLVSRVNVAHLQTMILLSILTFSVLVAASPNPRAAAYYHWNQEFSFFGGEQGLVYFGEPRETILSDNRPSEDWIFHIYILNFVTPEMRKAGDFWLYISEPGPSGEGRLRADVFLNDARVSSIDTLKSSLPKNDADWLKIRLDPDILRIESRVRIVVQQGTTWSVKAVKIVLTVAPLLLEPPYWSTLFGEHKLVMLAVLTVAEVLLCLLIVRRLYPMLSGRESQSVR